MHWNWQSDILFYSVRSLAWHLLGKHPHLAGVNSEYILASSQIFCLILRASGSVFLLRWVMPSLWQKYFCRVSKMFFLSTSIITQITMCLEKMHSLSHSALLKISIKCIFFTSSHQKCSFEYFSYTIVRKMNCLGV